MFQLPFPVDKQTCLTADVKRPLTVGQQRPNTAFDCFRRNSIQLALLMIHAPQSHTISHPYLVIFRFGNSIDTLQLLIIARDKITFQMYTVKTL